VSNQSSCILKFFNKEKKGEIICSGFQDPDQQQHEQHEQQQPLLGRPPGTNVIKRFFTSSLNKKGKIS